MKFHGKHSPAFNYIDENYKFRFNTVVNNYEFKKLSKKSTWQPYDDRKKNDILLELLSNSIDVPTDKVNIFIESSEFSKDFNPFNEYFNKLKTNKDDTDYIGEFAKTIQVEESENFRDIFERFLVGTIDCILNPDSVNDVCLVFQAGQGIGKSRWMRSLLPKKFQKDYLYEGNIDTRNKDHTIYLSQYWFIHLDELETLKSNEIGALKSYITRQRISERKAYGRYKSNFVRRASFLGSVNDDKFLTDTTGNRRWLVFKVLGVDYMHGLDSDKLWSQAYQLYKNGYRHWFNPEEIKGINEKNEKFRNIPVEEELLLRYFNFRKLDKTKKGEFYSASEMTQMIIYNIPNFNNKINVRGLGKALSKHSPKKKMKNGINKYFAEYTGKDFIGDDFAPALSVNTTSKTIKENDDVPF